MIRVLRKEGMESCVICSENDEHLVQCKDEESWARLYRAAAIRQHRQILDLSTGERDLPQSPVKYHFTCRKGFVNQKSLEILKRQVEDCGEAGKKSAPVAKDRQCFQTRAYFVRKQSTNQEQEQGSHCVAPKNSEQIRR